MKQVVNFRLSNRAISTLSMLEDKTHNSKTAIIEKALQLYAKKILYPQSKIASGPRNPRNGGIILSQLTDREQIDAIIKNDPFYVHGIAKYELFEFSPVKYHPDFVSFINNS